MDSTHDGIHREGNTIKLHSSCGIHREFNTFKQFDLFVKLHRRKCDICAKDSGDVNIVPQQYTTLENKKVDKSTKAWNEHQCAKARKKNKRFFNKKQINKWKLMLNYRNLLKTLCPIFIRINCF